MLVCCFLSQEEPKQVSQALADESWVEAMQEELLQFKLQEMDVKSAFLYGNITEEVYVKQPPGFEDPAHPNKVYRVVKALYGLHQAPRAWYERLSTFLLKHGYRRGAIDKTLFIKKDRRDIMLVQVYVDDIIFGSTKSSMVKDFEDLMQKEFKMSSMGELTFFLGLQVKQSNGGIFLSQDKYVKDILNKFDFRTIKPASTPIEAHKSLGKDEEGEDVDVHLYRSMIGCLMYLTASRPDIMFAVCLCARFQVTPKVSHLHAVKRIFRYLKHQPKLGLWYPKDSPFHLEAFSDSDYAGDNHDRRSTSGGCQYLGRRLVSWQCKKQTIVAISSTEAEYVAAASCCAQVLWMQNQLLDYGFNFMNTEIHIDNESTICIVKNPVFHSKTKHIQIRHHFIRDCYEQRLINWVYCRGCNNWSSHRFSHWAAPKFTLCWLNPELIGHHGSPIWATATLQVINDVPHIRAKVAGKKILISEATIRADLLFDDENGVDCFPKQVIWDTLRDIGYEEVSHKHWPAAREEQSTSPHSIWRAAELCKDSHLQGCSFSRVIKTIRRKRETKTENKKKVSSVNGEEKGEEILSEEHNVQEEITTHHFADDTAIKDAAEVPCPQFLDQEVGAFRPHTISTTNKPTQGTDTQGTYPKDKGKGILVEEPKKKKLTLQQIRALETTNDEEVARKIQAEWDAEEERKRFEELKKTKPKTTLRKPTSLAQERNQMMSFLKGQGYKNLQKLKYPQMKELYDKVQASIKDSFKDFVPMDSEKEREMLKERDVQRLSRKRKATITEAQPSKKPKLRSETIDELRNYLRVVDFEKNAQDKESLEGISMITELQVIDSPDGEYLIIHRANNHFRAFDTLWEILHVLDRQDLYHL
ncbi:putative ribonuclease H-like domain-containing protein [Tanacetum coccineum]|uniref:Ribonuclease H-like domain-containing protein n=1 Tax=Tanacetum coccineum TaxID=301880 RepID=A0ABQ5I770_9ASTR